jgi:hypothetical protein
MGEISVESGYFRQFSTTSDCAYSTTIVTGGEALSEIAPDVPVIVMV